MISKGLNNKFSEVSGSFSDRLIIIKAGGDLLNEEDLRALSVQVAYMYKKGAKVAIVHGGAPAIDEELEKRSMPIIQDYTTGMRLTDLETLKIADEVLLKKNALFSKVMAEEIGDSSKVLGISGYDKDLVLATKAEGHYSGIATSVNVKKLRELLDLNIIPVINPICKNEEFKGKKVIDEYKINPNGDDIAMRMFEQLGATDLFLCSDTPVRDNNKEPISELSYKKVNSMIDEGIITGGMITKVKRAAEALVTNCSGHVYILDGKAKNALKDAIDGKNTHSTRITNGSSKRETNLKHSQIKN